MLAMFLMASLGLWYGGQLLADSTEEAMKRRSYWHILCHRNDSFVA